MTTTTMHVFSCYHHNLLIQFVLEFCIHKHQSCYTSYGCHQYLVQFPFICMQFHMLFYHQSVISNADLVSYTAYDCHFVCAVN